MLLHYYLLSFSSCVYAATRRFAIEPQWGTGAPDGYTRQMILVNGTSPGPALIVDQWDEVEVCHAMSRHFNILIRMLVLRSQWA